MAQTIGSILQAARLLACVVGLALLFSGSAARAQDSWGYTANSTQSEINQALDALARLPTLRPNELDAALARVGFAHDMPATAWRSLSDKEQLTAAYRWARAAGGPENGDKLIAAVAQDYAKRYESIQFDPVFQQVFMAHGAPPERIEFRKPTASQLAEPLPPEAARLIRRLAVYVDGPGPLGRANIARKIFSLEGAALEDTLAERKPREFLHAGSRRAAAPPPVYQRLNELVRDVMIASEAAGADFELARLAAEFRKKFGDPPTHMAGAHRSSAVDPKERVVPEAPDSHGGVPGGNSGAPSGGGGGGGGSPERAARAAEMHRSFDAKHYSQPGQMRFSSVRARGGGRGGVIAGAQVTSEVGKARQVTFKSGTPGPCGVPGKKIGKGELAVVSDKGAFRLANVSCDVFFAARRLTYENLGVTPWTPGDAIGLASIDTAGDLTKTFPFFLPADMDLSKAGRRKGMLLHPGLIDLDIGRAVALLDLWPGAAVLLRVSTSNDPAVGAWLRQLSGSVTWKWSDSPATITAERDALVVRANGKKALTSQRGFGRGDMIAEAASDPKEKAGMIAATRDRCRRDGTSASDCDLLAAMVEKELSRMAGVTEHGKEIAALDAAMPALARNIADFARAEDLFRILSVMRWAKESGAPLPAADVQLAVPRTLTPDSIVTGVLGDYIAAAPRGGEWMEDCRAFVDRLQKAVQRLRSESDSLDKDRKEAAWKIVASEMRRARILNGTLDAPEFSCAK